MKIKLNLRNPMPRHNGNTMKSLVSLILTAPLLFLGCSSAPLQRMASSDTAQRHAPTPIHFWFDYPSQPSPGKRYWAAVGQTWIEQYEGGNFSRFQEAGRTNVEGTWGTLVVKTSGDSKQTGTGNQANFEAFIPDIGSEKMQIWYRNKTDGKWEEWHILADMKGIE